MMNSIKNLLAGNTKVKTLETAQKEVDKLQAQENELQGELSQAQSEHSRVSHALEIMEASLIINPDSKEAKTNKALGEKKLEELAKQISSTQDELSKVADKKQKAIQEIRRSRGEIARKHNVKIERDKYVAWGFNRAFGIEENVFQLHTVQPRSMDLGVEYGLGAISTLDPDSEDWKFLVNMGQQDSAEGETQAMVIRKELQEAIKAVFVKHDIELNEQSLSNIERI